MSLSTNALTPKRRRALALKSYKRLQAEKDPDVAEMEKYKQQANEKLKKKLAEEKLEDDKQTAVLAMGAEKEKEEYRKKLVNQATRKAWEETLIGNHKAEKDLQLVLERFKMEDSRNAKKKKFHGNLDEKMKTQRNRYNISNKLRRTAPLVKRGEFYVSEHKKKSSSLKPKQGGKKKKRITRKKRGGRKRKNKTKTKRKTLRKSHKKRRKMARRKKTKRRR